MLQDMKLKKLHKMERIQFDIKHLLRKMDGKKMEAQRPLKVVREDAVEEEVPSTGQTKSISPAAIFLIITLIVIAILVLLYIYNEKTNSTREIINENVKENGKS